MLSRRADAIAFAGIRGVPLGSPSTAITSVSSNSAPINASTWLSEILYELRRSVLWSRFSGRSLLIEDHRSSSRVTTGISVSGYIRAPPGSGLIAVVVPSSGAPLRITTFRTS